MILNWVWLGFILCAIAAALVQTLGGDAAALPRLMSALFDAARSGFEVSLGLVGVMALWLRVRRRAAGRCRRAGLRQAGGRRGAAGR